MDEPQQPAPGATTRDSDGAGACASVSLLFRAQRGDDSAREELSARYLPRLPAIGATAPRNGRFGAGHVAAHGPAPRRLHADHERAFSAYVSQALGNRVRDAVRAANRRPAAEPLADDHTAGDASLLQTSYFPLSFRRGDRAACSPCKRTTAVALLTCTGLPITRSRPRRRFVVNTVLGPPLIPPIPVVVNPTALASLDTVTSPVRHAPQQQPVPSLAARSRGTRRASAVGNRPSPQGSALGPRRRRRAAARSARRLLPDALRLRVRLLLRGDRAVLEAGRLPVASDCWQCYHPPLFYLLGLPFYAAGRWLTASLESSPEWGLRFLSLMPLAAGALTAIYSARLVDRLVADRGLSTIAVGLVLAFPCLFISSYAPEGDIVVSAFMTMFLFYLTEWLAGARPG